jgi:DNA-binding transcriptional MerR regulator
VVEFLGIKAPTFQQWMNRDIVPFEVVTRGGRTYRRFQFRHINEIAIIGALHAQGIEPGICKEISKQIMPVLDKIELAMKEKAAQIAAANMEAEKMQGKSSDRLSELQYLQAMAERFHPPTFPRVACVVGSSVIECLLSDSIESALREAGSAVCFVVDLFEINRRVREMRKKAIIRLSPGLGKLMQQLPDESQV